MVDQAYLKSKREAARYLGISIGTLERLVREGELPYVRIGILAKFRPEDLEDFIARQRVQHSEVAAR